MQAHEKVKLIREAFGLSQKKFAEKIGLKQRTLSYIESGTYNINYQFLRHLIQSYGVNIDWFFNDRGEMFEEHHFKLENDFFDREEMKLIEAMPNGKDYIIFYMKLLLKSIKNDGKLYFKNTIPYSPEMLATVTLTNIDTVKVAVDLFLKLGMMEKWDDGTLFMIETQKNLSPKKPKI